MDRIRLIETFIAVADAGSFTQAAEKLDLSPALVSKYVGMLEQNLQVRLFNRTTRLVSLTEIGRAYLEQSRQLVDDFISLETNIKDRQKTPSGHLVVSAPLTFGEMHMTKVVAKFLATYSNVDVDLRLTDRFINLIDEGIDLTVRIAELADSSLMARRLAPQRIIAAASPYYLEKYGTPTHPDDLKDHLCIIDKNFKSPTEWPFIINGQKKYFSVQGRFSSNSVRATRAMILSHAGIGILPSYVIDDDLRSGSIISILEPFEASKSAIYAVYLPNRYLAPKIRLFIDFMADYFSENTVSE